MSVKALQPGGPWEVRWREGTKNRSKRFMRKGDADAFDREIKRAKQLGPLALRQLGSKGPTLAEFIETTWAPQYAAARLADSTRAMYAALYGLHVKPYLGHLSLQDLTVGQLRAWQAGRLNAGVPAPTMVKARNLLSGILRFAAEAELIVGNPVALVRPPTVEQAEDVVPLPPSMIEQLRAVLGLRDATIVSMLAYSGIRPGEMRSLRWGDIGEVLNVRRGTNPDGTPKDTKTRRGRRRVRLLKALKDDLGVWRDATDGRGLQLVFPRSDGRGMTTNDMNAWREDVWVPLWAGVDLEALGLPSRPRIYDLRHSFASLLLAEGRTPFYVAEQLGHNPALTFGTYGHVIAEIAEATDVDADEHIAKARTAALDQPTWPKPKAPGRAARNYERVLEAVADGCELTVDIAAAVGLNVNTTRRHLHRGELDGVLERAPRGPRCDADKWFRSDREYASGTSEEGEAA